MMSGIEDTRLVALATSPEVKRVEGLADFLASLNTRDLVADYEEVRSVAPRRGRDGKRFFVERAPRPIRRAEVKLTEDLLEMALVNDQVHLPTPDADVEVIMRQFPLFSTGSRRGIRAVDLVGHGGERFWLVELKAQPSEQYGESPARALLEVLIYGAVVEANHEDIAGELAFKYRLAHRFRTAGCIIAAPSSYWRRWQPNDITGDWWAEFQRLVVEIASALAAPITVLDLGETSLDIDDGGRPRLASPVFPLAVHY